MDANFVFSFQTTDSAPTVTATTPANGAVNQVTNTNIDVTFSEPVNVTGNWFQIVCTTSGTRNPADTAVTPPSPASSFTINPNADFAPGEACTVTIFAAQVTDADANDPPDNMAANFVFNFTIDVEPSVTATTPTNGATQVANNTNISITFSEPVDVTGNWFQIVGATSGTKNVADTVVTGGPTTFDINPGDFANGELVTVTVFAAQVSDQDTNDPPQNMAANFVFSFTIDQPPSVTATTPTNGATGVAINSNVTITFSEPVNVTGEWFSIACPNSGARNVAATVVTGGPTTFTINPNADFANGEVCTVTVNAAQVTDQDSGDPPDNMAANFVFSFTTVDIAPTVTATTPTNGATDQPTNTDITVTFSEPVNVTGNWFTIACPTSGARNVAATVVTGGPTTFTINPNVDFAPSETCTVTIVATQVTDQDSVDPPDQMAANFVFSFSMDAAPTVNATTPTNGATQVANNTNITITFSEPVDVTGNWFTIVGATSGTRNVSDTVVTGGPTTFTINPNTDFTNGEAVTVTVVAAQVTDQDTNDPPQNMAANFVFSFTIDNAPAVTTTTPTNGATGVAANTNITVNFSESVNATTGSFTIQCPSPGNLQAFTLSASPSNTFTLDPVANLPEGVICTVTVIANQITDADAGDPPDNMVADFVFSFAIPPRAVDDARNATGNIRIQTAGRSGFSTLTNDIGPGITVTAFDATSLRGGQVSVAADGTFTYNPRAGFEGADSFNYTITNVAGSDVGTVNITVAGMIWFINTAPPATACATLNGVCGRLSDPLTSLPAFEAANGGATSVGGDVVDPEAGDHIFIFTGSAGYVGPLTLEANQRVIGQGAQQSLQVLSGITPATDSDSLPGTGGTRPSITTGGFNVVSNNQLYGLNFDDTNSTAINSVANIGTFTIADIGILNDASNGAGIVLDDGGTVTATGLNTIQTRSGVGLNVTNTQIGSANITFRSITVGNATADADPAQGILLNNTGLAAGNGGLIVTGNAGTCTEATPTCTGGRIQNTIGGDVDPVASVPGGTGISLRSTKAVSLTLMRLDNHQNYAIHGTNVLGFTLSNSVINGTNGTNVSSPFRDSSIRFDQLTGTNSITNSVISGGFQHNLLIDNQSGTSQITVSGNTIKNTNAVTGDDGFQLEAETTAVVNAFVTNNSFSAHGGDHFNLSLINSADVDLTFTGNAFAGGHAVGLGQGLFILGANFNGSFNYDISNNGTAVAPLVGNRQGGMIHVNKGSGTGTFSGRIQNNFIGNAAVVNSGSLEAFGIIVGTRGAGGSHTTLIDSNTVRQYEDRGIVSEAGEGAAALNATITNNTVSNFADAINSLHGIHSDNGINVGDTNAVCMDIRANSVATAGNEAQGGSDIRLRKGPQAGLSLRIPNLVGTDAAAAQAKVQADNPTATSVLVTGANFTGGAACTQPVLPAPPAGPITESATSEFTASATSELSSADASQVQGSSVKSQNILWAARGENKDPQNVISLTQSELSAMVQAAITRWSENGMSAKDFAKLQSFTYEIADLPEGQLATLKGNQITLDTTAAGHGWFFDHSPNGDNEFDVPVPNQELQTTEYSGAYGRIDLLTVLMRQLGSTLTLDKSKLVGPLNWLMENTLEPGTRRAPAFKMGEVGKLSAPKAGDSQRAAARSKGEQQLNSANAQLVASNKPRNSRNVSRHHANVTRPAPMSFVDVLLNIGILPAGKSVTIKFDVTVDDPWQGATNQVSNQGTVSGANFANVLTDDPDVVGAANPTVTIIDQPDVTVAVSPASVLEDGSDNLVYTFTRQGSTVNALTVNFSVGGTATFNNDYTQTGAATFNATSGTVSIPAGSATATVTLDPTTDITVEANETAILTVVAGTSYDIGVPASATGTITNDDTDVTVAVAPSSVEEDGVGNLVYTFTRNGVTTGALTVNFSVGGTATFNDDYTQTGAATFTATDGTVTFGAGNTTATVTVDPTADNIVEPSETVVLTVTTGTGYNVANPSTATGTIANDDAEVTVAVAPSSVDEDGATNLVYTFTRTGDTTGALTVNFSVGGTATFNTDYTQTGAATFTTTNGTVTFADGNSTATVTVDPSADATAEPDETVVLTLTAGTGYNIGTPGAATGTINNDDTTVSVAVSPLAADEDGATNLVYTFTRSDSSGALTVNFSVGGTATFNTDYTQTGAATFTPPTGTVTFADGSLTATVTVDPSSDLAVEPDETVILTVTAGAGYTVGAPASATGTITNDDTDVSVAVSPLSTTEDGAGNLVYTFTRTGVTTGPLTVNFTVGGTADSSTDYTQTGAATFTPPTGTVTFGAGSSTAIVTVDPTADNAVESDETVILTVATGTGYNVGAPSAATGTITNDDSSVSVAVAPSTVDEDGATNLVYTFTRTGSTTAALTVNFTVGGTADSTTDYTQTGAATFTPPSGTVTFAAGSSTATVTVDPTADASTEADETVVLTVVAGTGYEVGAPDSATGTINNDDNAVSVAVSPLSFFNDPATTEIYTFTRGDSSGELTVNFSIGGTATFNTDYTQTGAASFTPPTGTVTFADGSLTATVTVDPSSDLAVEPDETVILTVTAGAGYTVGVPASATGTITNDDTDVSVAVSPLSTTEDGAGNLVYTFSRNGVTTSPLTVNFSIGGTATFNTDYTQTGAASFTPPTGTVTFGAGSSTATVTVDPTADGAAELDETVILTVTAGTGYNVAAPSSATGTIINDDTEVSVAVSPSSVLEDGATNMVYTFTRVGLTSSALTVNFAASGTAVFAPPGGDYTQFGADTFTNGGPGTVTFLAGSSTATVTVDPFGDALLEPDETVILTVTAGAGYTVGTPNSATGTILNDDNSPPTIVVGYGQCGGGTGGTVNLLVGDVETAPGSLTLSATSSNTAVVPLGNISFGGSGANRTVTINALMQNSVQFSDVTITVSDGTFTSSINIRVIVGTNKTETINIGTTTVGTDMIFGGNGDDTINSGAGNDLVCGGNGGGGTVEYGRAIADFQSGVGAGAQACAGAIGQARRDAVPVRELEEEFEAGAHLFVQLERDVFGQVADEFLAR